ncbi:sporulation initiation inhibitor protein Soj [Legionella beliardensis]|uniref:Sporulation initiation inhibitor protein Soj n=1 Tax=Legionella beliardensis TaxID=91822 RepID=A0A378JTA9_9GAMM|nr:ParA family protein [Legionella beliardensis]STX55809.1 sporulation initiation inhibitor protein Soj [Legionella beliardensis]
MSSIIKENVLSQPKMSIAHAANFLNISGQAVHKQLKLKNISCSRLGNKMYLTYAQAKQLFNIKFNHKVIVGQIVKGGTGKTTSIANVASCANTYGAKVLIIDADPQGNLTDACGIDAEDKPVLVDVLTENIKITDAIVTVTEGIDLLPSRIENVILDNVIVNERMPLDHLYRDMLAPIANNYDFIFIDCPPTMGQAVTAASLYADIILAPLNPDKFSAKGLKILKHEIDTLNKRFKTKVAYKVFLNKFSSKTILSEKAIVSLINDPDLEGRILETTVQFSQEIPNITDNNKNLFSSLKNNSPIRDDFDRLTRELLGITLSQVNKITDDTFAKETSEAVA